jgi:hypothetical protein
LSSLEPGMTGAALPYGCCSHFLISRGITALRPRAVSPSRILIIPVVFLVWGLTGMVGAADLAT